MSERDHQPGDILDGRYRLVVRLGRGGFGDVWRAEELLPDGAPFRDVALKLLLTSLEDTASWAEEAKLLASFRHPSLVTIYAAGILRGAQALPYVAMELLEGSTLAEIIKARGRRRWRRVLAWARSTAAALDVIHARGVVHLDLKPANLFLSADGVLKVLDFGISRRAGTPAATRARPVVAAAASADANIETAVFMAEHGGEREAFATTRAVDASTARAVVGTPGYMAPEILELAEPTAAADAYALAVCVVQLITGQLPHAVANEPQDWTDALSVSAWWTDLRNATLRGELRDLTADAAGIPRGLVRLLVRLLAVDPVQRGVTPGELTRLFDEVWERPHGVPHPPYPGLAAFGTEAEGTLFGRADDIARFGREIEFEPCMVLQGARGTGKSSLARAGLLPHLARRGVDGKDDWLLVDVHLGQGSTAAPADTDAMLAEALGRIAPELAEADIEGLAAWCEKSDAGLLLLVDPLEHALGTEAEGSTRVMGLLAALAEGHTRPGLRAIGLLGERAASLLGSDKVSPALRATLRFLGPPSATAASDIVGEPLRAGGLRATGIDAVTREVRSELRGGDDRLPFVALALRAWWDACAARPHSTGGAAHQGGSAPAGAAATIELRGELWVQMGGVRGALAGHADRLIAAMDDESRELADEALLRLSTMSGDKLSLTESQLLPMMGGREGQGAHVLQALEQGYLLRRRGMELTIGHDALLTGWPHLQKARARATDRLICLERVREAALAWDRAAGHRDFLLRGDVLRDVLARGPELLRGLSPLEHEFVHASKRSARFRMAARGATVVAVSVAIAGGVLGKQMLDKRQIEAQEQAYLAEIILKSRRNEDPYHRVAWIAEAMGRHAGDSMLPLDLAGAVSDLPRAHFLTLEPVVSPSFPWDNRWLLAGGASSTVIIVDFQAHDTVVIEDLPLDADPETLKLEALRGARVTPIKPHDEPMVERVPLAFDTSFVTRSAGGQVRLWRLRENGSVALAATAPMRCKGTVRTAQGAPVLACATEEGLARWDFRKQEGQFDAHRFQGNVLSVSPDGLRVAADMGKRALLWAPEEGRAVEVTVRDSPLLAEWSPRDRVIAFVESSGFEILHFDQPDEPLLWVDVPSEPERARWDPGGLDFGVCTVAGDGRWYYLRSGGRAPDEPSPQGDVCSEPAGKRLKTLSSSADYRPFAQVDLRPHLLTGGFKLEGHRFLSRDLVMFQDPKSIGSQLLQFRPRTEAGEAEFAGEQDCVVAVERENEQSVAFQVGNEVRLYRITDGRRELTRKGNLLRGCADGRLVAWIVDGKSYRLFDPRSDATLGTVAREPGLVVGIDAACTTLYTQRLDGTLVATDFTAGAPAAHVMAVADGYVYSVHPAQGAPASASEPAMQPAAGAAPRTGLLMALSSGAIARIDDASSTVHLLGYATPRASAVVDGPEPGSVVYADDAGVWMLHPGRPPEKLLRAAGGTVWEDMALSNDGKSMLLVSADRLAALELARREVVGSVLVEGKTRFTTWDSEGSLLLWSFDRMGRAEGDIIPRGVHFAQRVAAATSNLHVKDKKLVLRR